MIMPRLAITAYVPKTNKLSLTTAYEICCELHNLLQSIAFQLSPDGKIFEQVVDWLCSFHA